MDAMANSPDLVIRGGSIADGLGGELFEADVAITDGRITEVGRVAGKGKEEIDARGRLVARLGSAVRFVDDSIFCQSSILLPLLFPPPAPSRNSTP